MQNTHFTAPAKGGSVRFKIVNPDLLEERKKCTFDQEEMEDLLLLPGAKEYFKPMLADIRKYPELKIPAEYLEMPREEQQKWMWGRLKKLSEINPKMYFEDVVAGVPMPQRLVAGIDPTGLHYGMFLTSVTKLGSDEQNELWSHNIKTLKWMGCYAQTELGHGSNVAGLETTATLDLKTDEFVIHSPTPTSTKYWPGGLGLWATHAAVFAQCIINGKNYGVQVFLVQIRDLDSHLPVKGVKVGDIGAKLGYNSKDNGWLMFNEVRIPRVNMFCRFACVDSLGKFETRGNPKVLYQTMVEIRYQIVAQAGHFLRKALIIGTRYAVCRRQFHSVPGQTEERKILDYQSHMFKFGPLLAESYVMMVVGTQLHRFRNLMNEEVKNNKFKTLDLLHHFTSGLKSLYSTMAYDGIETVRVNCGGAGYSVWSFLPQLWSDYSPVPVYEGDNTVMAQQTVGYIQKKIAKIMAGKKATGIFEYLNDIDKLCNLKQQAKTLEAFLNLSHLETCLAVRAAWIVRDVMVKLQTKDVKKKTLINDIIALDLLMMSRAHHTYLSFVIFVRVINEKTFKDPNIKPLLHLLAKVFALKQLSMDSDALYETGFFGTGSKSLLLDGLKKELVELRPHMIPLVELNTDEYEDFSYLSAIGNKYGDIYERQLELAMNSRLNQTPKPEYWDHLIKPVMNMQRPKL